MNRFNLEFDFGIPIELPSREAEENGARNTNFYKHLTVFKCSKHDRPQVITGWGDDGTVGLACDLEKDYCHERKLIPEQIQAIEEPWSKHLDEIEKWLFGRIIWDDVFEYRGLYGIVKKERK